MVVLGNYEGADGVYITWDRMDTSGDVDHYRIQRSSHIDGTYTDVTMTQGTLRIKAAKAVIQQVNGDMSRVQMTGGVTLRQQLDDGTDFDSKSSAVDYDLRNEVVVFTGNVGITQNRGTLNGERVVYNMKTGQVESGGSGNGRVKMRILPKSAQGAPAKAGG